MKERLKYHEIAKKERLHRKTAQKDCYDSVEIAVLGFKFEQMLMFLLVY